MQSEPLKKALSLLVIVALHAPLFVYALTLHDHLIPGQSIGRLSWMSMLILIVLLALPYIVLAASRIRWNPPRARLNEPTEF